MHAIDGWTGPSPAVLDARRRNGDLPPTLPAATFHGTPSAAGLARGPVRVVRSLTDAIAAQPRSVLVADAMPATWIPLLRAPTAVVLARGGALSNTAIVLRELSVPAIVAPDAVDALRNGDLVEVNCDAGTVRRY